MYFVLCSLIQLMLFVPGCSFRRRQSPKAKVQSSLLLIINNLCETYCVQTCAADQYAVNIGPAHQTLDVICFNRATVQDPKVRRASFRYLFRKSAPDKSMHFLRLFRRGGDSGADGPNRLVSDDDTVQIWGCQT